jgi:hypothetical protein
VKSLTEHVIKGKWDTYTTTYMWAADKKSDAYKKYRLQDNAVSDLFTAHVHEVNGMSKHPKRDKVFSLAWQMGHSSGYHEVANYYAEISELFDDEKSE